MTQFTQEEYLRWIKGLIEKAEQVEVSNGIQKECNLNFLLGYISSAEVFFK